MAVAELIVSRRALLGAAWPLALAAPLARHPGLDPGSPFPSSPPAARGIPDRVRDDERGDEQSFAVTKWDRALAAFRRAEAVVGAAAGEPDEDRYNVIVGRLNAALRRLLRAPTPHLPALAAKLAAANRHTAWELTGAETCIAALASDAARLAAPPLVPRVSMDARCLASKLLILREDAEVAETVQDLARSRERTLRSEGAMTTPIARGY